MLCCVVFLKRKKSRNGCCLVHIRLKREEHAYCNRNLHCILSCWPSCWFWIALRSFHVSVKSFRHVLKLKKTKCADLFTNDPYLSVQKSNTNPLRSVRKWFYFPTLHSPLPYFLSRDCEGKAKHERFGFSCQLEKSSVNTCTPVIYSHCEWRCQKTIQLIFGRVQGRLSIIQDKHINTHAGREEI